MPQRLDRLEGRRPAEPCPACSSSRPRVWMDLGGDPPPGWADPCPDCGRSPLPVVIDLGEDRPGS